MENRFLIGLLFLLLSFTGYSQISVQNLGTTGNRIATKGQHKVDSALGLPNRKQTTNLMNGGVVYNSSLKTLELYDTATARWYQLPTTLLTDGLISGGIVNWTGTGLQFYVGEAIYVLGGVLYNSNDTTVTLSAANPSLPRLDVIGLNISGVIVLTGTPAADPAKPQVTPGSEIELTSVLINAGATTPAGITDKVVYDENTEFTITSSGHTLDANYTINPFHLTKSLRVSTYTSGAKSITFLSGTPFQSTNYGMLILHIRLLATYNNNQRINVQLVNEDNFVVSNNVFIENGVYNFSRTVTGSYQTIQIPMSAFQFTPIISDPLANLSSLLGLKLVTTNGGAEIQYDYIRFQGGISIINTSNVYTAGDGLTLIGSQFKLGGAYANDIAVTSTNGKLFRVNSSKTTPVENDGYLEIAPNYFQIFNRSKFNPSKWHSTFIDAFASDSAQGSFIKQLVINESGESSLHLHDSTVELHTGNVLGSNSFGIKPDSGFSYKRISYNSNYGNSFTKHSLVDKNFVDSSLLLKLNKTDTTAKWVTKVYRKTASDSVFYIVGGIHIFSHKDSVGVGGGGVGDSSWITTETGTAVTILGTIANVIPSGSLPTGWVDNTPTATVTNSPGRISITGGVLDTITLSGLGVGTAYANRIEVDSFYNYGNMRYRFTFVPQTKNSTSRFAFTFLPNSLFYSSSTNFYFNLTNTDSAGVVVIRSLGANSITYAATHPLAFSVGDSMEVQIIKRGWQMEFIYKNKTTGGVTRASWSNATGFGTGGKAYFGAIGGSQDITHFAVDVFDRPNYGIAFVGDSQFAGSGATSEEKTVPNLLFNGNKNRYSNLSNGSATLAQMINSHVPNLIRLRPEYVIVTAGFNDRRDLATDTNTYRQRLDSVVAPLVRAGITPILTTLVPASDANDIIFTTAIINLGVSRGVRVIRIDSALYISSINVYPRPNMIAADGVHWSDSGMLAGANLMRIKLPELDTYFKGDTTSFVQLYNVPTGDDNMEVLRVDARNRVYKFHVNKFDGIINAYNRNGASTIAQANSQIHTSGPIKSDSAISVYNPMGLIVDFNGGTNNAAGTSGSNMMFSNRGVAGIGFPFRPHNVTGLRNIIFDGTTIKGGGLFTYSGSDNFIAAMGNGGFNLSGNSNTIINTGANVFNLTSGSGHIWMGTDAGRGLSTGSNVINFATRNSSAVVLTNFSDGFIAGDLTSFSSDNLFAAGDWSYSANYFGASSSFWFGGRTNAGQITYMNAPSAYVASNQIGGDWYFRSSKGRGTGRSGPIYFQSWVPVASGTTLQSTANTDLTILHKSVTLGIARFQTSKGANVASAGDLTLGNDGNVFHITGVTTINAITTANWQAGSEIILIFDASVTVSNNTAGGGGTAVMLLAGGVNFSATVNDVLKLVYDGVSFYEVSRSVN